MHQKKILFVEDSALLQKTFGEVLTQEGFRVVMASDGEAGLSMARKEKPDLILLD
ncbi:response regulator, partial [Candidatus Parcubacteria bacterium]